MSRRLEVVKFPKKEKGKFMKILATQNYVQKQQSPAFGFKLNQWQQTNANQIAETLKQRGWENDLAKYFAEHKTPLSTLTDAQKSGGLVFTLKIRTQDALDQLKTNIEKKYEQSGYKYGY